jgi:hypothetical protein
LLGLPPTVADVVVILAGLAVIDGVSVLTVWLLRLFVTAPLRFAGVGEVSRFLACAAVAAVPIGLLLCPSEALDRVRLAAWRIAPGLARRIEGTHGWVYYPSG